MSFNIHSAIAKDNALPANAFRINGNAVLAEGVELQLNHPLTGGEPALFIGTSYVKRDGCGGCFYSIHDGIGIARRIKIEEFKLENRKTPVRLLRRPIDGTNSRIYLQIDPKVDLGKNVTLHDGINFWSGVESTGTILEQSYGEAFVEMTGNATATVYYSDGKVARVSRDGNALTTVRLSLEEQAGLRLDLALRGVEDAHDDLKRVDFWYHQMVTMLAVGGKRSKTIFDRIYSEIVNAAASGKMGHAVKRRAHDVLLKMSPSHVLALELSFESRHSASVQATPVISVPSAPTKKGVPADRAAYVRSRAAQRADERAKNTQGARTGKGSSESGGDKVKLPTNPKSIRRRERAHAAANAR